MLKECHNSYILFNDSNWHIKLKKDYIISLEDTTNFAVVGRLRDTKDEQALDIEKL